MAADKYLSINGGVVTEVSGTTTSVANKIVALDASGKLHSGMMPAGTTGQSFTAPAYENIPAGSFVNVFEDGETVKIRKADADNTAMKAHGFSIAGQSTTGQDCIMFFAGQKLDTAYGVSAGVGGTEYYLGGATGSNNGKAVTSAPTYAGGARILQRLGYSLGGTAFVFDPGPAIVLAA